MEARAKGVLLDVKPGSYAFMLCLPWNLQYAWFKGMMLASERIIGFVMVWIGLALVILNAGLRSWAEFRILRWPQDARFERWARLRQSRLRRWSLDIFLLAGTLLLIGSCILVIFRPAVAGRAEQPTCCVQVQNFAVPRFATSPTPLLKGDSEGGNRIVPPPVPTASQKNPQSPGAQKNTAPFKPDEPPVPWGSYLLWGAVFIVGMLLLGLGTRLGNGKGVATAALGVLTMGASVAGGTHALVSFKVDKIESLFRVEGTINPKLDHLFDLKLSQTGGFSPGHLIHLEGFCSGEAEVLRATGSKITNFCTNPKIKNQKAYLIVVGATDRKPLRGKLQVQYESNLGLARARAESVRNWLLAPECGLKEDDVVALISGPKHTSPVSGAPSGSQQKKTKASTEPKENPDRSVDVWAFWDQPLARKDDHEKWPEVIPDAGGCPTNRTHVGKPN